MKDTRLTPEQLEHFVSIAYGGTAYRVGRQAQARALSNLLRGKPLDGPDPESARSGGK